MPKYQMEVVEILTHTFLVEADSEEQARELAGQAYGIDELGTMEDYFMDVELHDITVLGLDN
jgi:DNA-dependent RNA polymerase auxiliary subunit epsilon